MTDPLGKAQQKAIKRMPTQPAWAIEDIPYHKIAWPPEGPHVDLIYMIVCASFLESASRLYTNTLAEYFRPDHEFVDWLKGTWQTEELQHGTALRRYVQTAWPNFDWDTAYRNFIAEFAKFSSIDQLAPTRSLELAARCVIETGTASFYRMLSEFSSEPVLSQLTSKISADEVRHYKHYYKYFTRYREIEHPSRIAVLRTLWCRVIEIDTEDALYAYKHALLGNNADTRFHGREYLMFRNRCRALTKNAFPYRMAIKMVLKPLGLRPKIHRVLLPSAVAATRIFFLLR